MSNSKFNLVKGVSCPNLDGIFESYDIVNREKFYSFTVNVSAENMENLIFSIIQKIRTPGFFILEIGTNQTIEKELRKNDTDPFHVDVYYLDGGANEDFKNLFCKYKEILINDGFARFGFGSHTGYDELFIQDYKVFNIYTDEPNKYIRLFDEFNLRKVEHVKTVWENFSQSTPGGLLSIMVEQKSIYDVVEDLEKIGLYFAERRESK